MPIKSYPYCAGHPTLGQHVFAKPECAQKTNFYITVVSQWATTNKCFVLNYSMNVWWAEDGNIMDNICNLCSCCFWRYRATHNSAAPPISTSAGQKGVKEMQIIHFATSHLTNRLKEKYLNAMEFLVSFSKTVVSEEEIIIFKMCSFQKKSKVCFSKVCFDPRRKKWKFWPNLFTI